MPTNDYEFRPITFQGVTFPASLMGISTLDSILNIENETLDDWLWRFPICCGFPKHMAADRCARCARQAVDLLLEQRQLVLDGILDRLTPHGLEPKTTYLEWVMALQRIAELSESADGECIWSAPAHPRDSLKSESDARHLMDALTKHKSSST